MKNKKEHICKYCVYNEPIIGFGVDLVSCQNTLRDRETALDKFGNVYACTGFKRKPIDKKPKFSCKYCKHYHASDNSCYLFDTTYDHNTCSSFRRKKIDKAKRKKKKTPKEKLKERWKKKKQDPDLGYSLHYEFKSGNREGKTIKEVIDNDYPFIDFLIGKGFKINSEAVQYLHKVKEEKRKREQKFRQKQQEESRKWKDHFDRKTREDRKNESFNNDYDRSGKSNYGKSNFYSWEEFFNSFKGGGHSTYQHTSVSLDKQHGGVLGLNGKVQRSAIKGFWKKAALKNHPDKHNNSKQSNDIMKRINNAWDYFKKKYRL